MMRFLFSAFLFLGAVTAKAQTLQTHFETSGGKETGTYAQVIRWWQALDAASPLVRLTAFGKTDAGLPLHVAILSEDGKTTLQNIGNSTKTVLFILNGIHPGEPDGIDASMLLARHVALKEHGLLKNIVLAIVPVYNIGGALNRSKNFRIDQAGPVEKGFRGNAQNLDLNRDFIKMDSRNAISFARLFHRINPDIFIDNHVSNGADYQHVMTLLTSQKDKLGGALGQFMNDTFEPQLYQKMQRKGYDLVPYVNLHGRAPDAGFDGFWDSPRYSSGYAALWNTFGFVPETHMLKPYAQRVNATYDLMLCFMETARAQHGVLKKLRQQAFAQQQKSDSLTIAWKHIDTAATSILFKGYEAVYRKSEVTGLQQLYYDRTKPFEKKVPFYNVYKDSIRVAKPEAYIIPQGWWRVIEKLEAAGVVLKKLQQDTVIEVESYRIESYKSYPRPYESHHLNYDVQVSKSRAQQAFRKGDYLISMAQRGARFLVETLEPQAPDSYFAWNFFDAILQQKEGFSDYAFDSTAQTFLKAHAAIAQKLTERRAADSAFAKNAYAQLDFIFKASPYYEPAHLQYPVYRLMR